jgi:hypothetical protein
VACALVIFCINLSSIPIDVDSDMASETRADIVLYDLACTKDVCFSPVVWRIRLMLNYKQVPYRTVFLEFPDIEPTLKGL